MISGYGSCGRSDKGIYDAMNRATLLAEGDYPAYPNCGDYLLS